MKENPFTTLRRERQWSQQELAGKLGISRQLVGLIECGQRRITADNANVWDQILGVPREFLCPLYAEKKPRKRHLRISGSVVTAS